MFLSPKTSSAPIIFTFIKFIDYHALKASLFILIWEYINITGRLCVYFAKSHDFLALLSIRRDPLPLPVETQTDLIMPKCLLIDL